MALKWVSLSTYLRTAYPEGEAPDPRTIRRAIDRKEIVGKRHGKRGHYSVQIDDATGLEVAGVVPVNGLVTEILSKVAKAAQP